MPKPPTEPVDDSIPPDWPAGATPGPIPQNPLPGQDPHNFYVWRILYGPTRDGKCTPVGQARVVAWYQGACKWDIVKVRFGTQSTYQLQGKQMYAVITVGGHTTTTPYGSPRAPVWVKVSSTKLAICSMKVLQNIKAGIPPCGEIVKEVPAAVDAAAAKQAAALKLPRGKEDMLAAPPPPPGPELWPAPPTPPSKPHKPGHAGHDHEHEPETGEDDAERFRKEIERLLKEPALGEGEGE